MLRQVTDDAKIIECAAQVAFNQEELAELIESEESIIYLCGKEFVIPAKVENKTYIGVNSPQVKINVKTNQELIEKNIIIKDVKMPDYLLASSVKTKQEIKSEIEIQTLSTYERTKQLYGKGEADAEKLYLECKYEGLLDKFIKLSNNGVERANYFIVQMYSGSYGDAVLDNNTNSEARQICDNCSDILAKVQGSYIHNKETGEFASVVDSIIDDLRKMADAGDSFACFEIDGVYREGYTKVTLEEADGYIDKASELGNMDATFWIARRAELDGDYKKAIKYYDIASKNGHPIAQNNLGLLYECGKGVNKDIKKAVSLYSSSANKGCVYGQYNLAECYYRGKGVAENDEQAAVWYQKAAEKNYSDAQNMLGVCYENGHGVEQDYETAYFWYEKAAEQGNYWGIYHQGAMHIKPYSFWSDVECYWGMDLDTDYGISLLEKSIEMNNVCAMKLLADYYKEDADGYAWEHSGDEGREKIIDLLNKAFPLYKRAADNGDKEAKELLEGQNIDVKVRKMRAIFHNLELDESANILVLKKITDALAFMGTVENGRYIDGTGGIAFFRLDYKTITSKFCRNEEDIVYVCVGVYIDSNKNYSYSYDTSTMWCLTKDSIILHDANSLLVKIEKSFFRNKEKVITDITIPYTNINNVEYIDNKEMCIAYNENEKIKIKLRNEGKAMNPGLEGGNIGCWNQSEKIVDFLNKILKRKDELL